MSKFFIQEILIAVKLLAKTINAQGVLFVVNKKFENLKELQDFQMENARILKIDNKTFPCGFGGLGNYHSVAAAAITLAHTVHDH